MGIHIWTEWSSFPPQFTRGLEATLFRHARTIDREDLLLELSSGADDAQATLQNIAETTALERECRSRGLAISGATPQQLVERLRHFQEYWVPETKGNGGQQEDDTIQPDPELDGEPCDDEEIAAVEAEEA